MSRVVSSLTLVLLSAVFVVHPLQSGQGLRGPDEIVREWFERWNALDGSEEASNRVLDLYLPDAIHQIPPSEHQIGAVVLEGRSAIKTMVQQFSEAHTDLAFRIEWVTANEESAQLLHRAEGPWGGFSIGVQYVGVYTRRESGRRFMYPGAAFFQIHEGKIRNVRFYMVMDELTEISPP